jgi:surface antigen
MASPVYGRVAAGVPATITTGPPIVMYGGVPCQTVTQTINIGGQSVNASAVLCRGPDGQWRIDPSQQAGVAQTAPRSVPPGTQ